MVLSSLQSEPASEMTALLMPTQKKASCTLDGCILYLLNAVELLVFHMSVFIIGGDMHLLLAGFSE